MEYQAFTLLPWITGTFWVTAAVIVFLIIFGRRILGPVNGMLDGRAAIIRAALDEAAQLKAEAQAMLADAKARQEQAIADARQILASAHAEAGRISEELTREAEATARRRKQMAQDRIAAAEKAALHEVSNIAVDVATAAVAQLLRNGYAADINDSMIDHAIAGIPAALHQAV
jgi:F-type H+-transporting ATPase subunit b